MGGRQTRLKEHATHRNRKQNEIEIERSIAQHGQENGLSLIHISEPTRQEAISYAVFCLKKNEKGCDLPFS